MADEVTPETPATPPEATPDSAPVVDATPPPGTPPPQDMTPQPDPVVEAPPQPSSWETLRGELPLDLRNKGVVQNTNGMEDAMTQLVNLNERMGKDHVTLPDPENPKQVSEFYSKLGRPDEHTGYDLSSFEAPAEAGWDQGLQDAMVESLWKRGATQDQVIGTLEDYKGFALGKRAEMLEKIAGHNDEVLEGLKQEWGGSFDERVDLAGRAVREYAEGKHVDVLKIVTATGTPIGSDPAMIRFLAGLGETLLEHQLIGDKGSVAPTRTAEQATAELASFWQDPKNTSTLFNQDDPQGASAMQKKLDALYADAYGNTPVADG